MSRSKLAMTASLVCATLSGAPSLANDQYQTFSSPELKEGRAIWLATCAGCHGYGIAGAPIPMKPPEWAPRLAKKKSTLYRHAIEGFFGDKGTMMPPRGGNDDLSDADVQLAVDYMVALAKFHQRATTPQN